MYGLPPNADLSFFQGKTLQQVCVGLHEMILNFDEPISVTIMSPIACTLAGASYQKYDDYRAAASVVAALLQDVVVSAKGEIDGTLTLEFCGGGRLVVYDDSKHYESYVITNGDKLVVV